LHGPLKKNYKEKIKFGTPPLAPWGPIFRFSKVFFENIKRRSVRVPKLHRGFILTKKEILTTNKFWRPPLAPWGAFLVFLWKI
jgi:hypothetical protein